MSLAAELIKKFEGCRLKAYPDPASGGAPWTIGFGCTGPGIGPETVWTQEQADEQLEHRLAALLDVLGTMIKVPLTEQQQAALASLAWNIGSGHFAQSTVLRELNQGEYAAAGDAFLMWNRAAGKVLADLTNRRIAERAAFLGETSEPA